MTKLANCENQGHSILVTHTRQREIYRDGCVCVCVRATYFKKMQFGFLHGNQSFRKAKDTVVHLFLRLRDSSIQYDSETLMDGMRGKANYPGMLLF